MWAFCKYSGIGHNTCFDTRVCTCIRRARFMSAVIFTPGYTAALVVVLGQDTCSACLLVYAANYSPSALPWVYLPNSLLPSKGIAPKSLFKANLCNLIASEQVASDETISLSVYDITTSEKLLFRHHSLQHCAITEINDI